MTLFDFRKRNSTVILSMFGVKFQKIKTSRFLLVIKVSFSEKSKNNFTVPLKKGVGSPWGWGRVDLIPLAMESRFLPDYNFPFSQLQVILMKVINFFSLKKTMLH